MSQFADSTLDELDRFAERAEKLMNAALEQRRWNLVQLHREETLAADAERKQRLDSIDKHEMAR